MTSGRAVQRRLAAVVAAGIFVSSVANTQVLALPFRVLLQKSLGMDATSMATFFGLAMLPWYAKPAVGWLSDRVPLGRERRRPYLLLGALVAGLAWTAVALSPVDRASLLLAGIGTNLGAVMVSTVSGGLLVEGGQRFGMARLLARIRTFVSFGAVVLAGPVAGRLAEAPLGATAALAILLMLGFVPLAWKGLAGYEDRAAVEASSSPRETTGVAFHRLVASRGLWVVAAFVVLLQTAPGFQSPLFFFQTETLGFSPQLIGVLNGLGSVAAMLVALGYEPLARRFSLTARLRLAVVASALGALAYVAYLSRPSALVIETFAGAVSSLTLIALFELAARATPRGLESLGYALLLSLYTVATQTSDVLGSWLHDRWHLGFRELVAVNAGSTLLVLLLLPLIPAELLAPEATSSPGMK